MALYDPNYLMMFTKAIDQPILKLELVQHIAIAADIFVEVMKLNLGRYSEARLGQDFEF